ncbi:hypothetical protein [Nostoc favosum]|uniref:Uncharacterized protein n=1 Tax=Nostoc favosum CHAB5714 TaxID=2780399 RepID=A0ABS8I8C6_9NOSO|nr:hypothetical protein [Nostoc favosum]MCC5599969.1 hypothetical protein [Nostoc favosum CHAB5714]
MQQCYGWKGKDGGGVDVWFLACASNPGWTPNPVYGNRYHFPSDNGINLAQYGFGATPGTITLLNEETLADWLDGASPQGSCDACLLIFKTYCENRNQAKIIISGQEYLFPSPLKVAYKDKTLYIKNNTGNMTIGVPDGNSFQVSCDEDCPEGSHKCTHNKYPGYCCVPCKEIGDRLKNLANKVGR